MTYTVRADDAYVQGEDSVSVDHAATVGGTLRTWPPAGTVVTRVTDDADSPR